MPNLRPEADCLGTVEIPADKLRGAQTQRVIEHFTIGRDLMPRAMFAVYAIVKRAAASAKHAGP
jgi:fumarate hydratase class II